MRAAVTDLGITIKPRCASQAIATCADDLPYFSPISAPGGQAVSGYGEAAGRCTLPMACCVVLCTCEDGVADDGLAVYRRPRACVTARLLDRPIVYRRPRATSAAACGTQATGR